jgi:hypothetical protein
VRKVFLVFLIAVVVCGSLLGVMAAAQTSPKAVLLAELSAPVRAATEFDDDVLVAAGDEGLVLVRPDSGEVINIYKVTGQEIVDVFVVKGKIYALAHVTADRSKQLQLVNLSARNVKRTIALGGSVSHVPGFLPDGRLIVIEGGQVRFMDIEHGRTRGRVTVSGGLLGHGHLVGEKLYVARRYEGGIAVIDTKKTKLLSVIDVADWLRRVQVVGRHALVTGTQRGIGIVDLDTRVHETLEVLDYHVNPAGEAFVLESDVLSRLDYGGQRSGQRELPNTLAAEIADAVPTKVHLLSVNDQRAMIAIDRRLWRLEFPQRGKAGEPASK